MFISVILFFLFITNSFALTNSTPAEAPRFDSVIFIRSDAPDSRGERIPDFCNGTLLNSHVMITAAHCIILAYISNDTKMTIQFGAYRYHVNPDGTRKRIGYMPTSTITQDVHIEMSAGAKGAIARRGEKATISPIDDVALLWWNNSLPETSALTYPDLFSKIEYQTILKNLSATPLNVVSINPLMEQTSNTRKIASLNNVTWTLSNYLKSKSVARVEEGDSGAPIFATLNGKMKLFGVVLGRGSTIFDNWDVYSSANLQICPLSFNLPMEYKKNFCY